MPRATLLHRELLSSTSLTSIVTKAQNTKPPLFEYDINFNSTQLDLTLVQKPPQIIKSAIFDEGFESDIDSLSLISSDESLTSSTCLIEDHVLKNRENDSANGSSSSESDTEVPATHNKRKNIESFPLNDVVCYTDVKFAKILLFVVKSEVIVFSFEDTKVLQSFYTSFNTLKAIVNQRTYGKNLSTNFNLLQRTDINGVTHIEIARQPNTKLVLPSNIEHTSIISINTPDTISEQMLDKFTSNFNKDTNIRKQFGQLNNQKVLTTFSNQISDKPVVLTSTGNVNTSRMVIQNNPVEEMVQPKPQFNRKTTPNGSTNKVNILSTFQSTDDSKIFLQSETRSSRSEFYPQTSINSFTLRPKSSFDNHNLENENTSLKKVWKSAEDLLEAPKRPERRRKPKGKAPLPPIEQNKQNILKGQFVRVSVDHKSNSELKSFQNDMPKPTFQTFSSNVRTFSPNWNNLPTPKSPLILTTISNNAHLSRNDQSWTNSVPRLLKKQRSKSETRTNPSKAYRYIDTTSRQPNTYTSSSQTISNRLFGLSQKLKEFSNNVVSTNGRNFHFYDGTTENRRNSLGEMTYKAGSSESNLKSVIKKQDEKKNKNGLEKKVTFSAYATVQVV